MRGSFLYGKDHGHKTAPQESKLQNPDSRGAVLSTGYDYATCDTHVLFRNRNLTVSHRNSRSIRRCAHSRSSNGRHEYDGLSQYIPLPYIPDNWYPYSMLPVYDVHVRVQKTGMP